VQAPWSRPASGWTAGIAAGFGRVFARGGKWIAMVVAPAFSDSGHGETHRGTGLQSNAGPAKMCGASVV